MYINNEGQAANIDDEMTAIVLESFKGTKKFLYIGALGLTFHFFALWTFVNGLIPLMFKSNYDSFLRIFYGVRPGKNTTNPDQPKENQKANTELLNIRLHLFFFLWPLACFAYHYMLSKAYNKPEKWLFKVAKILLMIVYFVILIVSQKIIS